MRSLTLSVMMTLEPAASSVRLASTPLMEVMSTLITLAEEDYSYGAVDAPGEG